MNNIYITEQERQAIERTAKVFAYQQCKEERKAPSCMALDTSNCDTCGIGIMPYKASLKMAEFALTELRKPKEDLVKQILAIMDKESKSDQSDSEYLLGGQFANVAREIAELAPFRMNTELLQALKTIQKYTYDVEHSYSDIRDVTIKAIQNAEISKK